MALNLASLTHPTRSLVISFCKANACVCAPNIFSFKLNQPIYSVRRVRVLNCSMFDAAFGESTVGLLSHDITPSLQSNVKVVDCVNDLLFVLNKNTGAGYFELHGSAQSWFCPTTSSFEVITWTFASLNPLAIVQPSPTDFCVTIEVEYYSSF